MKKRDCLITDCERESEMVGDSVKLFADDGERFQRTVFMFEKTDDTFPTLNR
jgi:hypothetical protein